MCGCVCSFTPEQRSTVQSFSRPPASSPTTPGPDGEGNLVATGSSLLPSLSNSEGSRPEPRTQ